MDRDDRRELGKLHGGAAAIGLALMLAALYLALSAFLEARDFESAMGEVVGTREVVTGSAPRQELLVTFQTGGGDTLMFAEAAGVFAPETGDAVTVWYRDGDPPRALVARQKFVWPALLSMIGLVLSIFGIWRRRRRRPSWLDDPDLDAP